VTRLIDVSAELLDQATHHSEISLRG
jgi:hypothetical protein